MKLNKLIIVLLMFSSEMMRADDHRQTFDSANAAYAKKDYVTAIKLYENIISANKESATLYYNLGNAYLKSNDIGKAILNYERAKKLDPDDEEINTNLKLATQKTEDKIENAPTLFFAQWDNGVTDVLSEKAWSILLIVLIIAGLLFVSLYIFSEGKTFRQLGFFIGVTLLLLAVPVFFMAKSKFHNTLNSNAAVILSPSVTVTGSPDEKGTKLFMLHEGTKVKITETDSDWAEIRIANGNVGWVKSSVLEEI
jgi:tetratricopeptide (TPR) repeat protein